MSLVCGAVQLVQPAAGIFAHVCTGSDQADIRGGAPLTLAADQPAGCNRVSVLELLDRRMAEGKCLFRRRLLVGEPPFQYYKGLPSLPSNIERDCPHFPFKIQGDCPPSLILQVVRSTDAHVGPLLRCAHTWPLPLKQEAVCLGGRTCD